MDSAKKAEFVRVMGKKFLRLRKGGVVQHFDSGGTILGGPGTQTQTGSGIVQNISNALGTNAASANTQAGTNATQLNNAYTGATNGLNAQVGLTNTLTPQASTAVTNQNTLAGQELNMASGNGPNPAAAQLAQSTGANVANQAALMAGQRGASANPGLMARQSAMTGAATQQGAAGQAATLEANQQINAQNNLANLSANQINQAGTATSALNTAQQNEQNILQNANTAANNNAVSMQSNINNNNANTNSGLLSGITNAASNIPVVGSLFAKGGEVGPNHPGPHKLDFVHKMTKMALAHFDAGGAIPGIQAAPPGQWGGQFSQVQAPQAANVEMPGLQSFTLGTNAEDKPDSKAVKQNDINQKQINSVPQLQQPILGSSPPPVATDANSFSAPALGQMSAQASPSLGATLDSGVSDYFANKFNGGEIHSHFDNHFNQYFAGGGMAQKVPAMVSPKELYLSPDKVKEVQHGANPFKVGYRIPGKDKVKGKDSLKNDTVPMQLDEGGIVVPLHITKTMSPDKAALFVLKALSKKKAK